MGENLIGPAWAMCLAASIVSNWPFIQRPSKQKGSFLKEKRWSHENKTRDSGQTQPKVVTD